MFRETHESILELLEAIPGFQGSRNISPLGLLQKNAESIPNLIITHLVVGIPAFAGMM
jgi:hypothetical protein